MIADHHLAMLAASGIGPKHAALRGYETITQKGRLAQIKIVRDARGCVPGLLVPMLRFDGSTWGWQYRPDVPRIRDGKPVKYETPWGQENHLDVPPGVGPMLGDPNIPLFITEGSKKADCGVLHGLCVVALPGVWNFRGTNNLGGKVAIPDWQDIALNNGRRVILGYDGDLARKDSVQKAAHTLAAYLAHKGAKVEYLWLPDTPDKTGLDDYLMGGHTVADLWSLVKPTQPPVAPQQPQQPAAAPAPKPAPAQPISIEDARDVFHRWLGNDYDIDALDTMLATIAVEKFDDGSDPIWLLIISGSAAAKTETVQSCDGIGAIITSSISGEAALLSATPKKDRAANATGGLLRKIGDRGVLVIKDVTSILSMNKDIRGKVLSALREIYDGRWYREVGAEGGHTLEWRGRLVVIGAVTTAWDTAHAVIASMGDRFVLLRIDSTKARMESGRQAIGNTGDEEKMRAELAAAVGGVIAGMNTAPITVTNEETEKLLKAADLVTRARTGVQYDYKGDVIDVHALEMPTRFAKQLTQILRGAVAIGMNRDNALRLAIRCARDSMPPLRLAIVDDLSAHRWATPTEVRKRLGKPRATVDRQLQALHILGVLTLDETKATSGVAWHYSLATGIDPSALVVPAKKFPEKSLHTPSPHGKGSKGGQGVSGGTPGVPTDISGNSPNHTAAPSPDSSSTASTASATTGDPSTRTDFPWTPSPNGRARDFRIGDLPGRCSDCEWHIPTMGHKPGCQHIKEKTP